MNTSFQQDPPVRIDKAAHAHLRRIIGVLRQSGLGITMARWLSDLILAQPIPNGYQPPATDPCEEEKEKS